MRLGKRTGWRVLTLALLGALAQRAESTPQRMPIAFAGYTNRAEALVDFPVLVVLSNGWAGSGFSYGHFVDAGGYDLRFYANETESGAGLDYEIDTWNTNGASFVWVRVPQVPGDGSGRIWAKWGDPANSAQLACTTNGAVWASGYVGVWHLNESGSQHHDSAGSNNVMNNVGSLTYAPAAKIGGGWVFNGNSANYMQTSDNAPELDGMSSITLEGWFLSTEQTQTRGLISKRTTSQSDNAYSVFHGTSDAASWSADLGTVRRYSSTPLPGGGAWRYQAVTYNAGATNCGFFVDGQFRTVGAAAATIGSKDCKLLLGKLGGGAYSFHGQMDEVRIATVARSTNWLWATYQTVTSNTLFSAYGTTEAYGPPVPTVTLAATGPWAYESPLAPTAGVFTVSRGAWTNGDTVVGYTIGSEWGAATPGPAGDYTNAPPAAYAAATGSVTIAAGETDATITVWPVDDATSEYAETVTVALRSGAGYTVGSPATGSVTIRDDETNNIPPSVSAGADQSVVGNALPIVAALDGGVFDDGRPAGVLTQLWTTTSGPGAVTFGNATNVDTTASFDSAGTYVLQLQAGDGEALVSDAVTITVTLNELSVLATDPVGRSNLADTVTFTVYRPAASTNVALVVNYALGGTASSGTHYTIAPASGQVVFPLGQTNGPITVTPLGAAAPEQTVELTLLPGDYAIGTPSTAAGTLLERKSGVMGLQAVHRQGQTFLTWSEPDSPVQETTLIYSNYLALMSLWTPKVKYRVYRSDSPITDVAGLTPVGETGPLSCWNSRSTESAQLASDMGLALPLAMVRYVVADGQPPLPPGTGLYAHNPQGAGPLSGYYAVTQVTNGVENTQLHAGNTLAAPVAEAQGQGTPVLQSVQSNVTFNFSAAARLEHYVRWEAPPHANAENKPNNIVVAIPPNVPTPTSLGLHLHSWGASPWGGYGWWFNAEAGSILVASDQIPYDWWTGYHESYGKIPAGPAWTNGVVYPYTQRRVLSLADWAMTQWSIDSNRVFSAGNSMGGSGSPMLAIRHPERVAWTVSWVGVHSPSNSPDFKASYQGVYGDPALGVKFEDGTPVWNYFDDVWYLRQYPARETPFITFANGKNDVAIGWSQARMFLQAMQDTKRPHIFVWGQNGHNQRAAMPLNHDQRVNPIDIRVDQSLPAFTHCSLDDNPGNGDPLDGAAAGAVNYWLYWTTSNIVDEAGEWQMTMALTADCPSNACSVNLTPRRLQRFHVSSGDLVDWTSTSGGTVVQAGTVAADADGLLTIEGLQVHKAGTRVRMVPGGVPPGSVRVSASAGAHGTVSPSGSVYLPEGGATSFVIRADAHYHIGGILTNGAHVAGSPFADNAFTNTTFVWSEIQTNGTLSASFDENLWSAYAVPETWLAQYYPATNDYANAAIEDTDRDGHAAWQEHTAGTDPTVTTSVLAVTRADWQAGTGHVLRWSSASNRWYRVDVASNLQAGFEPLTGLLPATPPLNTYTDQTATPTRFYDIGVYTNQP